MTKTSPVTTTIQFLGPMAQGIMWDEPEMVQFIQLHALAVKDAVTKVYVAERDEATKALHWPVVITSPRGRQSYIAVQRLPGGPIYVTKD